MRLIVILPLLLVFLFLVPEARAGDLVLGADEWCPYNCDPGSDRPGFAVEVAREIFAGSKRGVTYRVESWARSIAEARAGRLDGIISATPKEAPDFVFPKEPVGMSGIGLAVRRQSDFRWRGAGSFEGRVIGAAASYDYAGIPGEYIKAHVSDETRVQFVAGANALALNLRKLAAGRVDVVVDDTAVLARAIEQEGLAGQLHVAATLSCTPVYIAFSPASRDGPKLARAFDEGMARLRASGRLAQILARYKTRGCR